MLPSDYPRHISPASCACFERVGVWLASELQAASGPLVVGIGGPGGCGKSTLTAWLRHRLEGVRALSLDDFRLPREARKPHGRFGSHPEANDLDRLRGYLEAFRNGGPIRQPVFDSAEGRVVREVEESGARALLADGEIAAHKSLRGEWDRFILVQAHWRTQLNTRLTRDLSRRKCSLEKAIDIFLHSNLRDYPRFAKGAEDVADVVLYRNVKHVFSLRRLPE